MNSEELEVNKETSRNLLNRRFVWIIVILVILTGSIIWVIYLEKKSQLQTINLNSKGEVNCRQMTDKRPALRIALAGSIAPKTKQNFFHEIITVVANLVGRNAELIQKRTYAEINDMLSKKEIDLAFVSSGTYVDGKTKYGLEILAIPVINGQKDYYSYIIAHSESKISSFADIRGKKFAFIDPHSNTGFTVPRYMLALINETPESFFSDVIYTRSHDNSIRAVAKGFCEGAAVNHLIWEFLNNTEPKITAKTKIVKKSEPFGIPPIVVHSDMNKKLKANLKKIFLTLHEFENTKKLINMLQIDRFEQGDDSMYNTIRNMNKLIKINENK